MRLPPTPAHAFRPLKAFPRILIFNVFLGAAGGIVGELIQVFCTKLVECLKEIQVAVVSAHVVENR